MVNVAMRSGTNALHGTAYEFLRNTNLNAVGYIFGTRPSTFIKPTLQQNQFGLTLGGPVVKNRVFFFGDYEGFRALQRTNAFARKVLADLPALTLPGNTVRANNLQLLALSRTYTDKFDAKMDGQINE